MPQEVRLLGSPRILLDDGWVDLPNRQDLLLLGYLAYRGEWVRRDALLGLFWPEEDDAVARHNLSQLLYSARGKAWAQEVVTERDRVRWAVQTDVDAFLRAVADGDWSRAVAAYDGELLQDVDASAHLSYEAWLHAERVRLHTAWRDAVVGRAHELVSQGDEPRAARTLEGLLQHDALAEDALQAYLRIAAGAGRRDRALDAYARFERELDAELGIEPLAETRAIAERLRSGTVSSTHMHEARSDPGDPLAPATPAVDERKPSANAPSFMTPFIGRERELSELDTLFDSGGARQITLIGPGGVGKTRLALRLLDARLGRSEHGGVFVSLAPISSVDEVARAALDAAGWDARGRASADALIEYAKGLEKLWVFDNFEHVVDAAELIPRLLEASPKSRILVTSRVALRLRGEVLYELAGLGFPSRVTPMRRDVGDAVQLFVQGARRVDPGFRMDPSGHEAVARICGLLQGLPLGIELAAAWSRTMTPSEIAVELETDLALLDDAHVDLPERQQGLRAVFEHSWSLLAPKDQQVLTRLSVFHGGFTRTAAEQVAGASAHALLALVNASLLTRAPTGRFLRHVAVHRYAEDELRRDVREEQGARSRHAEWFASLLEDMHASVIAGDQIAGLNAIGVDFDNVRVAWSWSISAERWDLLERMVPGLARFLEIRGRFVEASSLFEDALAAVGRARRSSETLQVVLLANLSAFAFRLGEYDRARAAGLEGLGPAETLGMRAAAGLIHLTLGNIGTLRGHYADAGGHYRTSLDLRRATGDAMGEADLLNNLGVIAFREGRFEESRDFHRKSLAIKQRVGHQHGIAMSLGSLGSIALQLGNLDEAAAYLEESLALRVELQDRRGEATIRVSLGELADRRGDARKAVEMWREGLQNMEALGNAVGTIRVLARLGSTLAGMGAREEAAERLAAAIQCALRHGVEPYLATALTHSASILAAEDPRLGLQVLDAVLRHSSTLASDLDKARTQRTALGASNVPENAQGNADLAELADRVLVVLAGIAPSALRGESPPPGSRS